MSKKEITIDDLLQNLKNYDEESISKVCKAYDIANTLHAGQKRQSGEPYIIHPLNVAVNVNIILYKKWKISVYKKWNVITSIFQLLRY